MPDSRRSPSGSAPGLRLSAALYRILVRTLPQDLRGSHGDAMVQTFRDLYRSEYRRGGFPALVSLWRRVVTQTIVAAAEERLKTLGHRRARNTVPSNAPPSGTRIVDHFWLDLRFAVRSFRKKPAFTITAVTIIALGIGATTAIFSVVDGVVLRDLPYPDPNELVYLDEGSHTVPDYQDWTARTAAFEAMAAVWRSQMDLLGDGPPVRVNTGRVTPSFFSMFGGVQIAGRLLTESDARGPAPVAVLSHAFWQSRFGGDADVIGRTIELDGGNYEVVGVLDPRFSPPRRMTRQTNAIWIPLDVTRADLQIRSRYVLSVVGRLRDGARIETAGAEIDATMQVMAQEYPQEYVHPDGSVRRVPLVPLHEAEVGRVRDPLLMLLGAVGLMLLIACANVANLFLARGTDREREVAVRAALGASRRRIGAQLLTESVLLSFVGGAIGVALAFLGVDAFTSFGPSRIPRLDEIGIDYRVLTFSVAASIATGVVFGIAPAFYAAQTDVNRALKNATSKTTAGRGHLRLKGLLVIAEIALALVLLVGAGLLFNSFVRLTRVDPGFEPDRVMAIPLAPEHGYDTEEARLQFARETLARVRGIPGVSAASIGITAPFADDGRCCWMTQAKNVAGDDSLRVVVHPIAPHYFSALGVRLNRGRDFTPSDDDTEPPPVIITEALVQRLFDAKGAIGNTVTLGRNNPTPFTVVGVVNDVRFWSLSQDMDVAVFVPFEGFGAEFPFFNLVVRTPGQIEGLPSQIREAVWTVDPRLPVPDIFSLSDRVSESITEPRFLSTLLLAFAGFAILLAAGGIYGTMLYAVNQRSHELGIRLALGASAGQLRHYVLKGGATLAALGLAIGLAGAIALSRILTTLVFGITAQDVPTYAAVTALLAAVALLACYLPARKAARLDPIVTLRTE